MRQKELHYTPQQAGQLAALLAEQNACAALPQPAAAAPLAGIEFHREPIALDDGVQRMRVVAQTVMRIDRFCPLTAEETVPYRQSGRSGQPADGS